MYIGIIENEVVIVNEAFRKVFQNVTEKYPKKSLGFLTYQEKMSWSYWYEGVYFQMTKNLNIPNTLDGCDKNEKEDFSCFDYIWNGF